MRFSALPAVAAACLLAPTLALSQPVPLTPPVVYVCTAAAQVVRVTGGTSEVFATGTGVFDDCVLGPDGALYVANLQPTNQPKIIRVDLSAGDPGAITDVATLPSRARGLAFNVNRLYVTTEASGVQVVDFEIDVLGPLISLGATPAFSTAAGGRGIAFDLFGNLDLVAGGKIWQATGPAYINEYSGLQDDELATLAGAYGLAMNTCREMVVADTGSRKIKRLANGTLTDTNISFPSNYRPLSIEIDSSNRIFMLAATNNDGKAARVMMASPNVGSGAPGADWLTTCGNFTVSTLAELKTGGPGGIADLLSTEAVGIAIGQSAHSITQDFTSVDCNKTFDFGYHIYKITNACASDIEPSFSLTVTAHKSRPADVKFAPGAFPETSIPISYSPNGGFITELTLATTLEGELGQDFLAQYNYFTQQAIGNVGVAKGEILDIGPNASAYEEAVGVEAWDLGVLDIGTGERERDWSKRVSYTSATRPGCTLGEFEQPLLEGNPLFNSNQTLKVALKVTGLDCSNGTMRVSVARLNGDGTYTPATVVSNSNDVKNIMTQSGQNLSFQMNLMELFRDLVTGAVTPPEAGEIVEFQLTIFGDLGGPKSHPFQVTK